MTPLEKAKTSKTFCIYPWVHQYVGPGGDVKPCCVYQHDKKIGDFKTNNLKEIWNNEETKKMRLDMLEGREVDGCQICDKRTNIIHKTHRDDANDNFFTKEIFPIINLTKSDGSLPLHMLKYIDARWNNLCNLRCRTCGPDFSTSWIEDHSKLYQINPSERLYSFHFSGKTETQLYDEIKPHLKHVKKIYFAGGEPLMQEDHYKILNALIDINHLGTPHKPLNIHYNTNFSQLKLGKYKATELWKHFGNVNIHASLDGSHQKAEYWRKGTNWNTIEKNRQRLFDECPNVKFRISFTLSWVNAFNVFDFHKEWVEKGWVNPEWFHINCLEIPKQYCLKWIPNWKKKKIEKEFNNYIDWLKTIRGTSENIKTIESAIKFMNSEDVGETFPYFDNFCITTLNLDKIRNENFWEVYPEHQDMKEFLGV